MTQENYIEQFHELLGLLGEADSVYQLQERYDQGYIDMEYERYLKLIGLLKGLR